MEGNEWYYEAATDGLWDDKGRSTLGEANTTYYTEKHTQVVGDHTHVIGYSHTTTLVIIYWKKRCIQKRTHSTT